MSDYEAYAFIPYLVLKVCPYNMLCELCVYVYIPVKDVHTLVHHFNCKNGPRNLLYTYITNVYIQDV